MIEDVREVNREALHETARNARALPILMAAMGVYIVLCLVVAKLLQALGPLDATGLIAGLGNWFVMLLTYSHFAAILDILLSRGMLRWSDLRVTPARFLVPLSQVYFLLYLIEYIAAHFMAPSIRMTFGSSGMTALWLMGIAMLWSVLTDPIFETVYIGNRTGAEALLHLVHFWAENWLHWLPYAILSIVVNYFVLENAFWVQMLLRGHFGWLVPAAVYLIWTAAGMLFRAYLFRTLYRTTRRSRAFQRKTGRKA